MSVKTHIIINNNRVINMSNIVSLNDSSFLSQTRADKNKVANELLVASSIGLLTGGLTKMTDVLDRSSFLVDVNQIKKEEEELGKLFESLKENLAALGASKGVGLENGDDGQFSMTAIFEMGALLMKLMKKQIDNTQSQSEMQAKSGEAIAKMIKANYEDIIKQMGERKSFWDFLKDIFKAIFDALADVFTLGAYAAINPNQGEDFKAAGKDLYNIIKIVVDALHALGLAIEAIDPSKRVEALKDAKALGEEILKDPAMQWLGQIVAIVVMVVAGVTGQFELLAVTAVLFTLSETGAMGKLTDAMAKAFGDTPAAKVLADILTIVIITVATLGVALPGTIESSAEVAVNAVESELTEVAEEATEEITTETAGEKTFSLNGKKLGGLGLVGFGTAFGSSSLLNDILKACRKDNNEGLEIFLSVLQSAIAVAATLVGGGTILSSAETEGESLYSALASKLKSLLTSTEDIATISDKSLRVATDTLRRIQRALAGLSGIGGIASGASTIEQGVVEQQLAIDQGNSTILTNALDATQSGLRAETTHLKGEMKEMNEMMQAFSDIVSLPGLAVADALRA